MGRSAYYRGISQRLLDALIADPRLVLGILALGRPPAEERYAQAAEALAHLPVDRQDEALRAIRMFESLRDCFPAELEREAWGLQFLRKAGFTDRDLQPDVDIEKRWYSLRDLLDDPRLPTRLGYAVTGGTEIGEDLGYGPAGRGRDCAPTAGWRPAFLLCGGARHCPRSVPRRGGSRLRHAASLRIGPSTNEMRQTSVRVRLSDAQEVADPR